MSNIDKHAVQAVADLKAGYTLGHADVAILNELARIALASLEAEAVGEVVLGEYDDCGCHPDARVVCIAADGQADWENFKDGTRLYTAPQAPVSVPDEVTAEDCPAFVKYDVTDVDEAWARGFNACRAAMLQSFGNSEQLNSPVIPDGWKLVPIDPTKDMLRAGQSVVGFWLNTVHCYSKMLAAAPAAPQQEAK